MIDQNFGHKELYEVVLRAKVPMKFGERMIEAEEPVLYFEDMQMSLLSEQSRAIFARGGWGNMPRVIWEDRSEVLFQMTDGVMSNVGMSILLSSRVLSEKDKTPLYINMKEGPLSVFSEFDENNKEHCYVNLKHMPVPYNIKKTFIFDYELNAIQEKIYGKRIGPINNPYDESLYRIELFKDKNCTIPVENNRKYVVDYYYEYVDEALIYSVEKERFNGLFTLEAKFYSKDENEGQNYTNILYMPKVRIVSSINLRLGERADPTVSTFNIIGLPETVGDQKNLIMEITRLGKPIDEEF